MILTWIYVPVSLGGRPDNFPRHVGRHDSVRFRARYLRGYLYGTSAQTNYKLLINKTYVYAFSKRTRIMCRTTRALCTCIYYWLLFSCYTVVQNAFIFVQLLKHIIHSTETILVKVYAILNAKEIRVLSVQERDFYTSDYINITLDAYVNAPLPCIPNCVCKNRYNAFCILTVNRQTWRT